MIIDNRYYRIKSIFGYRLRALVEMGEYEISKKCDRHTLHHYIYIYIIIGIIIVIITVMTNVFRRSVSSSEQWSQCDLDCPQEEEEETKGNLGQHISIITVSIIIIVVVIRSSYFLTL